MNGPAEVVVRAEIVLLLDGRDVILEFLADVEVLLFGLLEDQEFGDHGVEQLGLQDLVLLVVLFLGRFRGLELLELDFELLLVLGEGDDVVIDDGHDLLDDLGRGRQEPRPGQPYQDN